MDYLLVPLLIGGAAGVLIFENKRAKRHRSSEEKVHEKEEKTPKKVEEKVKHLNEKIIEIQKEIKHIEPSEQSKISEKKIGGLVSNFEKFVKQVKEKHGKVIVPKDVKELCEKMEKKDN